MENKKSFVKDVGKMLLEEYEKIKRTLNPNFVYNSADVANICKLARNVTFYCCEVKALKNLTEEEKHTIRDVKNINEYIDAFLTGRQPFQAIMPEEMRKEFEEKGE